MNKGIKLALLAALISGFSVFANKIFISAADPLVFTFTKNTLAGVILFGLLIFSGKHRSLRYIKKGDWIKLGTIGLMGGGVAFALFFTGLSKIGAVQGNLIHKTLFIWTAVLAIPFLKEKLNWKQILGYLLLIGAIFIISGPVKFTFNNGALLVLLATIIWAGENVFAKSVLKTINADIVGVARIILGLPILLLLTLIMGKGKLLISAQTLSFWPLATGSLFLTFYILTWYKALKYLPATQATAILVIAPMITNLLTDIIINKHLVQNQTNVSLLLTIGVLFVVLDKKHIASITSLINRLHY